MGPSSISTRFLAVGLCAAALALAGLGCGDSGSATSASAPSDTSSPTARSSKDRAPSSVTRQLENLRSQFPLPHLNPALEGAAAALAAGREACRGKTPLAVKEAFASQSHLGPAQAKMIAKLPSYEAQAGKDPSFTAGQLGALVYEMSLSRGAREEGFGGCVYELARQLERELGNG
jgi:hypothetical protein